MEDYMEKIEIYKPFEVELKEEFQGNPYTQVSLFADFSNGKITKKVRGFYDENNSFKIRFMPQELGKWTYVIKSNIKKFDNITGDFLCTEAKKDNHGIVITKNHTYFEYSDGTPFFPFGTTLYGWHFQNKEKRLQTLELLKNNRFNKVRMVVFPIWNYMYTKEYESYPYKVIKKEKINKDDTSNKPENYIVEFDYYTFNAEYFQFLEEQIKELDKLGIEVDLILFHPYDTRGLASMTQEQDFLYLEYIVARLASFKNIWWSMANEYDLADMCGQKPISAWDTLIEKVYQEDPNRHLLSIHNFYDPPIHKHTTKNWYDHTKPWITHLSIQTDNLFFIDKWKQLYRKPIVIDECRYEGNVQYGWGNLTAQNMNDYFWKIVSRGGYVTHGEAYVDGKEPIDSVWTFHGSKLKGKSHLRMNFLRNIIENNHISYLNAIATTGPHWELYCGATEDKNTVLIYFGDSQPEFEEFDFLPDGKKYQGILIDTWNMTTEKFEIIIDNKLFFKMPNNKPYQALLLKAI